MRRFIILLLAVGLAGCQNGGAQAKPGPPSFDPGDTEVRSQNCHDGQGEFAPESGLTVEYGPIPTVKLYSVGQGIPLAPGEKDIAVPKGRVGLLVIPPDGYIVGLISGKPDVGLSNIHGQDPVTRRSLILYPGKLESATICLVSIEYAKQFGYVPMDAPTPSTNA